jgi:transglutaminase-like putative cysteine protease
LQQQEHTPTLRAFRIGSRGKCWHTATIVVALSRRRSG